MGFGLVGAGFVFLFNPNINVIDMVPDFIGFLLIYAGLSRAAHINADIKYSRRLFLWLAAVDFLKALSFSLTSVQDPTRYLLFSFTFGVALCLMFTPALLSLFEGIDHLGMIHSAKSVLRTRRGRDVTSGVKRWILAFYYVRTILSVLPEFSELQLFENLGVVGHGAVNYSSFKTLFYFASSTVVLVLAVPFLVKTVGFFVGVSRDADFTAELRRSDEEFITEHEWYIRGTRLCVTAVLCGVALLLLLNPSSDGMIKLPLLIPCAALIFASITASRSRRGALSALIPAVICAVLSVIGEFMQRAYLDDYSKIEDAVHYERAREMFLGISWCVTVQYIAAASALVILFIQFRQELRSYSAIRGMDAATVHSCIVRLRTAAATGTGALLLGASLPHLCLLTADLSADLTGTAAAFDMPSRIYSWASALQVLLSAIASVFALRTAYAVGSSLSDEVL